MSEVWAEISKNRRSPRTNAFGQTALIFVTRAITTVCVCFVAITSLEFEPNLLSPCHFKRMPISCRISFPSASTAKDKMVSVCFLVAFLSV